MLVIFLKSPKKPKSVKIKLTPLHVGHCRLFGMDCEGAYIITVAASAATLTPISPVWYTFKSDL